MRVILPAVLIAAIPLVVILWRYLRSDLRIMVLRTAIILCLALAIAGLSFPRGEPGSDLIIVADRSLSLPSDALQKQEEIVEALAQRRGPGDRLGLVAFGRGAHLAGKPAATGTPSLMQATVDAEASDLAGGIRLAISAVPRHRPARLLVLSDGLFTGPSPLPAAFEALERTIPLDYRFLGRKAGADIAVEDLLLPGEVPLGTPFQIKLPIFAETEARAEIVLRRGAHPVAQKTVELEKGLNQILFRDLPRTPGILSYHAEAAVENDPIPDNNRALGAVEVVAPKRILLINQEGRRGNLAQAIEAGSLPLDVRGPDGLPASLTRLVPYRVVILENVAAIDLPSGALGKVSRFVTDLGGGLLLTGGRASFGVGGYYLSRIDPILPVSMELKEEHRALSVAMVIALDRSGSMQAETPDGYRKMDLANLGACAAIELLSPLDQVAVLAVDSAAHLIVRLTDVKNPGDLMAQVRGIDSMGGGIMTDTAMEYAAAILGETDRSTRHLVLFADAADAEETAAGRCAQLVQDLKGLGATVSVIGLGTERDTDAGLLKMIAEKTNGRVYFTDKARDLPQLFAMETITVSRSSFIEEQTQTQILPDINLLGELYGRRPLPDLDGYNMSYLKPGASCGIRAQDEYQGPIAAFWSRGLGRVAAFTAQVDGDWGRRLLAWPHYADFFVTLLRYLEGEGAPGLYVASRRNGNEGVVTVEVDPDDPANLKRCREAQVIALDEQGMSRTVPLIQKDTGVYEARFPLMRTGVYFGSLKLAGGTHTSVPPLALPYSPEHALQRTPESGRSVLNDMARITGGVERLTWEDAYAGRGGIKGFVPFLIPLLIAVLLLHVAEIAFRRLGLRPGAVLRQAGSLCAAFGSRLRRIPLPSFRISALRLRRRRRTSDTVSHTAGPPAETSAQPSAFDQARTRAAQRFARQRKRR